MSNIQFVLGASADIASSDEVRSAVKDGTDTIMGRLSASARWKGNRRRIPASVNNPVAATGTWVLDFGSPQGNYMWWLVDVVVTAADDRTAPVGALATLYSGNPARQATSTTVADMPLLGQLVRPGTALPALFTFHKETWPVHDGENLFSVVYSATTALTVVSAVATVMELDASNVMLSRG